MKKFKFTLQTVYNLALSTDKQQKMALKKIEDEIAMLNNELEEMKTAYLSSKERCQEEMQNGISSEDLAQYSIYFESQINAMITQKEKIIRAEEERERIIQARVKTRKEIKTLEKLRQTQYEEYMAEMQKQDELEVGDVVSFKLASK